MSPSYFDIVYFSFYDTVLIKFYLWNDFIDTIENKPDPADWLIKGNANKKHLYPSIYQYKAYVKQLSE